MYDIAPRFQVVVLWHPEFQGGSAVAEDLFCYFGRNFRRDVGEGMAIDVIFRSAPQRGGEFPLGVPLSPGTCTAAVLLVDSSLCDAPSWIDGFVAPLVRAIGSTDGASRIFVVNFTERRLVGEGLKQITDKNRVRVKRTKDNRIDVNDLCRELSHDFCSLLIPWVRWTEAGETPPPPRQTHIERIQVFISHAKLDGAELGERVHKLIGRTRLGSFFDAHSLRSGDDFTSRLKEAVEKSAVLAVQTDTFASREWCRMEVITAKRLGVPLVVLHAVQDGEARGMPYLGNVPTVRWRLSDSRRRDKTSVEKALELLLLEVLRDLNWRLNADRLRALAPDAVLMSREPELATLIEKRGASVILYPDPPLGDSERLLLDEFLAGKTRLLTPSTTEIVAAPKAPSNNGAVELPQPLVALSVSESQDIGALGFGEVHFDDVALELCRIVLQVGCVPAYGGDLREKGYTREFAELVKRYGGSGAGQPLQSFLAWPEHCTWGAEQIDELEQEFDGKLRAIFLDQSGRMMRLSERKRMRPQPLEPTAARAAMTAMRRTLAENSRAQILVGGRVTGYLGQMPGVAEEALTFLKLGRTLFLVGGYGGCTRDIIHAIGGDPDWVPRKAEETGVGYEDAMGALKTFSLAHLGNGLTEQENRRLFVTHRLSTILRLVARGLQNLFVPRAQR
jgi:hypothetical protein